MPKVSVITTVFNGQNFIDRSIKSILGQNYSDFEWVVVDDGSSDDTVSSFRSKLGNDPRVRIFEPGRIGRSNALNFAVQKSRGEYIANHDIDDYSFDHRLKVQTNILENNPKIGVVGGNHVALDKTRGEEYVRQQPTSHEAIIRAMTHYIPISHHIATFRKEVWRDVGGYPIAENAIDMRMWIRVIGTKWKMYNPSEVLGKHVIHTSSFWKSNFSYLERQIDLTKLNITVINNKGLSNFYYIYPLLRMFYAISPSFVKRLARKLIHIINK